MELIKANPQYTHVHYPGGKEKTVALRDLAPCGDVQNSGGFDPPDCGSVCQGGAEVLSTRQQSPCVNLRRSLRVGAWNVLFWRKDDTLSLLSSELKRLNIGIAALSEVRRPDSEEIMAGGYTYDWSGCSDGYHAQ